MATEYRLSYTATEIDEKLGKIDDLETLTLGVYSDGLVYIFKNGFPIGSGIELGTVGDVFGYVDENNNIILSGNLAEDTYTVKYEMEDGSTVEIGELVLVEQAEPTEPTNWASPESADWLTGYRLSGGNINTKSALTGSTVTNYVAVQPGDTVRIEGMDFTNTNSRFGLGKADKTNLFLGEISALSGYTDWVSDVTYDSNSLQLTISEAKTTVGLMRMSSMPTGTAEDVVITITRNGVVL